jgi:rod shape-determining protein MreD
MDLWVRHWLPVGVTLFLLLLTVVPTRIPGFAGVAPLLALMSVFYWSIFRPDLLPYYAAFLIGLLYDVISGTPLGVNALMLLLVRGVTGSQRRFFLGKSFLVAWSAFAMVAGGGMLLSWLLVSMLHAALLEPQAVMFEYLMTLSLYPVLSWMLARTQAAFLREA